jgi:hypothetical protein
LGLSNHHMKEKVSVTWKRGDIIRLANSRRDPASLYQSSKLNCHVRSHLATTLQQLFTELIEHHSSTCFGNINPTIVCRIQTDYIIFYKGTLLHGMRNYICKIWTLLLVLYTSPKHNKSQILKFLLSFYLLPSGLITCMRIVIKIFKISSSAYEAVN